MFCGLVEKCPICSGYKKYDKHESVKIKRLNLLKDFIPPIKTARNKNEKSEHNIPKRRFGRQRVKKFGYGYTGKRNKRNKVPRKV